jgi:hypothetical protein
MVKRCRARLIKQTADKLSALLARRSIIDYLPDEREVEKQK